MKLDTALAFCLLGFHFETLYGMSNCSSLPPCHQGNLPADSFSHSQHMDEFPKKTFTFHCPLPKKVKSFHMKLFKGQRTVCSLYIDNGRKDSPKEEFCEVFSSSDEVSFILRNLTSMHSDTYTCCLEIISPISFQCKAGEKHLYIKDESCSALEEPCLMTKLTSWILVGLTVISLVVCIFCLIACSFRNPVCRHIHSSHDYNNEYMSMAAVKPS